MGESRSVGVHDDAWLRCMSHVMKQIKVFCQCLSQPRCFGKFGQLQLQLDSETRDTMLSEQRAPDVMTKWRPTYT